MITSEERLAEGWDTWFQEPFCPGKIHPVEQTGKKVYGPEEGMLAHEYLNIEVKEGSELVQQQKKIMREDMNGVEPHMPHHSHPPTQSAPVYAVPDFIKVELDESENQIGKRSIKTKAGLLPLRLPLNAWETEQIFKRREQNRRRKALRRARETEEQRNMRREKERLAKAALRATETMEKRMVRRERDRIAKAISRAVETEEQRRIRREKNRMAMAALRASQTEEERHLRRERDRIKKAAMRAYETEEQKKIRREKNRIAMAVRRANLTPQERSYLRNVNRIAKAASRNCCNGKAAGEKAVPGKPGYPHPPEPPVDPAKTGPTGYDQQT